jgi:hypothetical protein
MRVIAVVKLKEVFATETATTMPNKFYDPQIFTWFAGRGRGECMQRYLRAKCASALPVRLFTSCLTVCSLVISMCGPLRAEEPSLGASTSNEARADAAKAIPLAKVDPRYRAKVQTVMDDVSLFRRLPTQVVDCDSDMFTFMAKNPEVLVEIWRELGITQVTLERIDATSFRMADNAGTTGKLVIVEQSCQPKAQNRIVMFAEGQYEGKPFNKPVRAQCVLLLRSGSLVENDGRNYVATRLDSFIHIDRASLEIFAKVLHPLVGKTADRNFSDTIKFVGGFSQAAEMNPQQIEHLASSLDNVNPVKQGELIKIAYACGGQVEHVASHASESATR